MSNRKPMPRPGNSILWRIASEALLILLLVAATSTALRADEPYARSKDYDLQHSRVALKFDVEHRKVIGDVTHTVVLYRDSLSRIWFDSVGLTIESVTLNKKSAKFEATDSRLYVTLPAGAHAGDKYDIQIKYSGKPRKGLYFILPDKNYPKRPLQIWSQGESEDTRYYLPTYDYPNDRLTTETILTVPAEWYTISNGKLVGVTSAENGLRTWTWRESVPSSTYLFTVVAGEFAEAKDTWRNIPVTYYAPSDRGDRLLPNYSRTPAMMELFSTRLGVDYPWEKYAQVMVDDFVAGGMENSSATTNTASSLRNSKLLPEYAEGEDPLISHELGHQWFGDLVTTKDWGNIWLNEGFATFMETLWIEGHFGKDQADYDRWEGSRGWFASTQLYTHPIVRHDFDDSGEFDGNAYDKGGWVLHMLRTQLGDPAFFAGLKHYLEVNRGKNVMTSDLTKAIEEATHTNVDQFFDQWVYGAGAPKFEVTSVYNADQKQVALTVKQTQKPECNVGIFRVPVSVEITNAGGPKLYPIQITKDSETFTLPSSSAPQMVLFDKGDHVLKSVSFRKEKAELFYQLKNAADVPDRADAAVALGKMKDDPEVVAALGQALNSDKFSGVQSTAAGALGDLGTPAAATELLNALNTVQTPWVRAYIAQALGNFKDNKDVQAKLESVAKADVSFRARAAALQSLATLKAPAAYETLTAEVATDTPDDFVRNAALRAFGALGDDRAVPVLLEWSQPGKEIQSREAAIAAIARLDKSNKELTQKLAAYLSEQSFGIRYSTLFALGSRGDVSAIPALESLLQQDDLSIEMVPRIKEQIEKLKNPSKDGGKPGAEGEGRPSDSQRLATLEQLVREMNERLKSMETRLPPAPKQ